MEILNDESLKSQIADANELIVRPKMVIPLRMYDLLFNEAYVEEERISEKLPRTLKAST